MMYGSPSGSAEVSAKGRLGETSADPDGPPYIAAASLNRRQRKLAESQCEADEYWLNPLSFISYSSGWT